MKKVTSLVVTCFLCGIAVAPAIDEASLNQAISSLNARARTDADRKLVLKAVSQQTKVPEKTLRSQMSATHLNYGELLTANSLAEGSGKNLNEVLALRKGKGWGRLAKELRIDPKSIVNRLRSAEKTVLTGQSVLTARNADIPEPGRRGSAYGPQAGGPVGDPMRGSH
jgi:hypothetical protein